MFLFFLFTLSFVGVGADVCADYSNWMSFLNDTYLISNLIIPGTHQSGSWTLNPLSGKPLLTQSLTLDEQLSYGVRFFDIYMIVDNSMTLYVMNDVYATPYTYQSTQDIFISFLRNNPSEFLILKIQDNTSNNSSSLFDDVFKYNIENYTEYYYINDTIPKIRNMRGKIYVIKLFNTTLAFYDYNQTNTYYDMTLTNCNISTISQKADSIEKHINNIATVLCLTFSSAYNLTSLDDNVYCTYLDVANVINPKLQQFIVSTSHISGMIIVDFITPSLSYSIFTQNDLHIDTTLEFVMSFLFLTILGLISVVICHNNNIQFRIIYYLLITSVINTSIHIFAIYYYQRLASYRGYTLFLTSTQMCIISVTLLSLLQVFNLLLLMPKLYTNVKTYFFNLQRHIQTDFFVNYNIQVDIYEDNYNYIYREFIDMNNKYTKSILMLLTFYGNCNYLLGITYNQNNVMLQSNIFINKQYKFCIVVMICIYYLTFVWDFIMIFMFDHNLVVPWLHVVCMLVSFVNIVQLSKGVYKHKNIIRYA